jgi:uncharacterized membrane protein YgcG
VLTIVTCSFSSAFLSLLVADAELYDNFGWFIFLAIPHYLALEYVVREKHHYGSGVDDALLWISSGFLTVAFVMATNADEHPLLFSVFIFALSGILSIRFVDSLMSLCCYLSLLAAVFFGWQKVGPIGNATMPFMIMAISGGIYLLLRRNVNITAIRFYSRSMSILQIASLLSFYAAGNYFVVKELNDMLNGTVSTSIPFGWFFWSWTVGMPLAYIFFGIKQKNTILLRVGLLLIAAAAGTYKAYYQLMPIEQTLVLCGAIALLISYFITRYLRQPKKGFTSKELKKEYLMEQLQLDSMVVGESFADAGVPVTEAGVSFGEGHFGGGGSGGGF